MKDVDHPNIIKLHETFFEEGILHLIMEYANDGDLSQKIEMKLKNDKDYFSEIMI